MEARRFLLEDGADRPKPGVAAGEEVLHGEAVEPGERSLELGPDDRGGRRQVRVRALAGFVEDAVDDSELVLVGGGHPHRGGGQRGREGLLRAIEQLTGAVVPASSLETLVLPARVADYRPALLDEVMSPSAPSLDAGNERTDGIPTCANSSLDRGYESSNVNAADAMVNMIELARQFELQVKAIRSAEENGAASAQLLRV